MLHMITAELSSEQERMWFLHKLYGPTPALHERVGAWLDGNLDTDKLRKALSTISQRHEVLRTTFGERAGQPLQLIFPAIEIDFLEIDLTQEAPDVSAQRALDAARKVVSCPFDLEAGPLWRACLLKTAPGRQLFVLCMHQLISDGDPSMHLFLRELAALLEISSAEELTELPLQYREYAQRQRLEDRPEFRRKQLEWWRIHLEGAPTDLELPTERPRPPVQSFDGDTVELVFPPDLLRALYALAESHGADLFTVLLAGLHVLLQHYSGQDDVLVGTPTSGREHSDVRRLIGYFGNPVVLRGKLSAGQTFAELLPQLQRTLVEVRAHAGISFKDLVEALAPRRDLSRPPLFQVLFLLRDQQPKPIVGKQLVLTPVDIALPFVAYDQIISVQEFSGGLLCRIEYNRTLFDRDFITGLLRHWENLLRSAAADPAQQLSAISFLDEAERRKILVEWNATRTEYPRDACIHELFETQAKQAPNAVAARYEGEELTYGTLNRKANRLAHRLKSLGVGPDVAVAICIERSLKMLVGLLGILKAGGAYVPLDPAYPRQRIELMLAETGAGVLVSTAELSLRSYYRGIFVDIDAEIAEAMAGGDAWDATPASGATAQNLAYVLFTSGSTGRPKGVAVPHRGAVRLVVGTNYIDIKPADRVLQGSTLTFDASTLEIWASLLNGARLIIVPQETLLSMTRFPRFVQKEGITMMFVTTALFHQMAAAIPEVFQGVRYVIPGGEALDPRWAREVLEKGAPQHLINGYGPTENTTFSTVHIVRHVSPGCTTVPIGRPIANSTAYVLNRHLQPVPVGVIGELYVGGDGLARGYQNRPELTAERFIKSPLSEAPGELLYRTGDRARYLPDGTLEFHGRTDNQIKIRGHRIELGEIESVLGAHEAIREVAVAVREDAHADKQIVAYFVPAAGAQLTSEELRSYLQGKMPNFMIPAAFVKMEQLPLTPHGKVDRRALPAPSSSRSDFAKRLVAPRTCTESLVADILKDLLSTDQIGIHDDFFALGGHSLRAVQLIGRIRSHFNVEVPLRNFFANPTVEGLASCIDKQRSMEFRQAPVLAAQRTTVVPLSFAQERLWFIYQLAPHSSVYNCPLAFRVRGLLDTPALESALAALVLRHEPLRTTFVELSGKVMQTIAVDAPLRIAMTDLRALSPEERQAVWPKLVNAEAQQPFDLRHGPLLRANLIRLDEQDHVFLLNLHHIVTDGWSEQILCRELSHLYTAFARGTPPSLPPLPIQYADYALWQRQRSSEGALSEDLVWWTKRLFGAPTSFELPAARPRPRIQTFRGGSVPFRIDSQQVRTLRALAARERATPAMVLLAAFSALLHRYTGQENILIGMPHANRDRPETDAVVGLFVNTIVLWCDLRGNPMFQELVARLRLTSIEAYDHAALPFDQVVKALHPARDLSRSPLVQIAFVPQVGEPAPLRFSELSVEALDCELGKSAFDLSLYFWERPDSLDATLEYNADLFDCETIERLAVHLEMLIAAAVEQPSLRISELPLLTEAERNRILVDWNDTAADYPMDRCIHQLFAEQVQRTPNALALELEKRRLTYGELYEQAKRFARRLRSRGVGPEMLVGLCSERSVEMLVGLLGILMAGGAYVPLDPSYPKERLAFMMEDAAAPIIVTQPHLIDRLPACRSAVLFVDFEAHGKDEREDESFESGAIPSNLAYVIYTSGSTGRPKGVMVEHKSVAALASAQRRALGVGVGSRVLQFASISFDAATWDIVMALTSGATLCLAPPRTPMPGPELSDTLGHGRISVATLPPSVMAQQPFEPFPELELLIVAGEACSEEVVNRWAPGRRFFNAYGPTEATVCATIAECRSGSGAPSIGRPIANTRVYILDRYGIPTPVGVPGELHIGGAGVARGYLNRPELTQERFRKDPFCADPQARIYQTGDLARFRPNGTIEYLGRIDQQVKLRGYRIELGEIEAALLQCPEVGAVVVVAQESSTPGDKRLVAYIVPRTDLPLDAAALRQELRQTLPDYMVPALFVSLESLPLTSNGKVDRGALPPPKEVQPRRSGKVMPRSALETSLCAIWAEHLGLEQVGIDEPFFDAGGDSLRLARVRAEIVSRLGMEVDMVALFQHPTIRLLAAHMEASGARTKTPDFEAAPPLSNREEVEAVPRQSGDIAIIAMVGRFPSARSVDDLWVMLLDGREGITRSMAEALEDAGAPSELVRAPGFVPAAGLLDEAVSFDAGFFGYSPLDARSMDPQQRLFLECAWEALESAGYDPTRFPGAIGVFGGAGMPRYWLEQNLSLARQPGSSAEHRAATGNPWQFLATQVSYKLGLRGPALTLQTACSTSLVAVHLACQSLLARQCEMALAGGVSLYGLGEVGYLHEAGGILSPDGRCRPYDAAACGTVPSSGVAIVVLKRLEDALAAGDTIRAVIRGSAVNNDGSRKVGYSAPSVEGQSEVILQALRAAGISAETVSYVEGHGTGTALGDPIEVAALSNAFRQHTARTGYCALGSLKSNIGHLDSAAGVAGLIKAALAVERGVIPGTVHFERPNPNFDLAQTPFIISAESLPWSPSGSPRRAGVSSFGIGGTNAHVLIEEPPQQLPSGPSRPVQILVLSARTDTALDSAASRLAAHLRTHDDASFADIAFTLQQGRAAMACRLAVVCKGASDGAAALEFKSTASVFRRKSSARPPGVVFLFPGVGTHHLNMGRELYLHEPLYRETLDLCAELFRGELRADIRALLFSDEAQRSESLKQLQRPSLNMAAIFATEYALSRVLLAWGVRPAAVLGHSLGEYAAACLAGVLELADAVTLVSLRGRLCDDIPPAPMLSIPLPADELRRRIEDELSIAAINGPSHCVVSGTLTAIEALEAALRKEGVQVRHLPLMGSFHSALVEPAMDCIAQCAATLTLRTPKIPMMSSFTGTWMTDADARDPTYWARQLRSTVRFADSLALLLADSDHLFLEVGPGKTLTTLALAQPNCEKERLISPSMPPPRPGRTELESLFSAIAQLWCAGVEVDWTAFTADEKRRRVAMPTYPFERIPYVLERQPLLRAISAPSGSQDHKAESVDASTGTGPSLPPAELRTRGAATLKEALTSIWRELLGVDTVRPHDNFFALGGDSLLAIEFRTRVKESLKLELAIHSLIEHPTFAALLAVLQQSVRSTAQPEAAAAASPSAEMAPQPLSPDRGRLLIQIRKGAASRLPLFLIPPAGGTAFTYVELAQHLDFERPVYAVRASGTEPGEPIDSDVPAMAARYIDELRELLPNGPYLLGGHSSGGVVAFEMACQLLDQGYKVPLVAMIDTVSTAQSRRMGVRSVEDILRLIDGFRKSAPKTWEMYRTALLKESPFQEIMLKTNQALASYQPRRCKASLLYLRACQRDDVFDPHAESFWMDLADGSFVVHNMPGNHFTILEPPNVFAVADTLRQHLDSIGLRR